MILTCPQCATRYQIEDSKFPAGGRKVRCAKCGQQWFQEPPAPEPASGVTATGEDVAPPPSPPPAPAPAQPAPAVLRRSVPGASAASAPSDTAVASKPRGERTAIAAGWIGLAAILFLIVWGGV